jgi:hypothetical protein
MEQVSILFPESQPALQNVVASYNNIHRLRGHGFRWVTGEFLLVFNVIN